MTELFDVVNENDDVIGRASRNEVHGNPGLIHRVAHVLVFNSSGKLYLQKRAKNKDVQPGKWDTSVGGHVDAGESYLDAALRETLEELGIAAVSDSYEYLYKYMHSNDYESEYVSSYRLTWDGTITFQKSEIDEGRFWSLEEIRAAESGIFTPNFLEELERYLNCV